MPTRLVKQPDTIPTDVSHVHPSNENLPRLTYVLITVDVGSSNLLITDSVVTNQDDCLAINSGNNITFQRNTCTGGHGVSIVRLS